ncbi:MAG: hypothetical protein AAF449_13275, partial [Myxococcota bacterium]
MRRIPNAVPVFARLVWPTLFAVGCLGPSAVELQRRQAASLRPVPLGQGPDWTGPVTPLKLRVYAEEGHRKAILGWQVRFYRVIERVNPVLRRALGVELEIVELLEWNRADAGGLYGALFDLVKHDPATDVDLVVGLVTPLPRVTSAHNELGLARLLGRHLVMRPGDDLQQFDALTKTFGRLEPKDREDLYLALRRHRAALVMLHEVGHALGALHVSGEQTIMAAQISPKIDRFHPENIRLMQIGLQLRRGEGADREALGRYGAVLASAAEGPFAAESRARMLSLVEAGPARLTRATQADLQPPPDPRRPGRSAQNTRQTEADLANRAIALASSDLAAAWRLIVPILDRYPNDEAYQRLGCQLALRRAADDKRAVQHCGRALALAPGSIRPRIWRGFAWAQQKSYEEAIKDARRADTMLARTSTAPPVLWGELARLYREVSAVTWAEAAASHADDPELTERIGQWANQVRRVYRLPADAANRGVPPEAEPDYLALRAGLAEAIGKGDSKKILRLQARLRRDYPRLTATSDATCRLLLQKRSFRRALAACRKVARASPRSADVQTLVAVAAFGAGQPG